MAGSQENSSIFLELLWVLLNILRAKFKKSKIVTGKTSMPASQFVAENLIRMGPKTSAKSFVIKPAFQQLFLNPF